MICVVTDTFVNMCFANVAVFGTETSDWSSVLGYRKGKGPDIRLRTRPMNCTSGVFLTRGDESSGSTSQVCEEELATSKRYE